MKFSSDYIKAIGLWSYVFNYKLDFVLSNTKGLKKGLDVCSGEGEYIDALNKLGKDVVGADVEDYDNPRVLKMNAENLRFKDKYFEFVYCFDLHHVKNKEKALKEMIRVAKYKVLINDLNYSNPIVKLIVNLSRGRIYDRGVVWTNPNFASKLGLKPLDMTHALHVSKPLDMTHALHVSKPRYNFLRTHFSVVIEVDKID